MMIVNFLKKSPAIVLLLILFFKFSISISAADTEIFLLANGSEFTSKSKSFEITLTAQSNNVIGYCHIEVSFPSDNLSVSSVEPKVIDNNIKLEWRQNDDNLQIIYLDRMKRTENIDFIIKFRQNNPAEEYNVSALILEAGDENEEFQINDKSTKLMLITSSDNSASNTSGNTTEKSDKPSVSAKSNGSTIHTSAKRIDMPDFEKINIIVLVLILIIFASAVSYYFGSQSSKEHKFTHIKSKKFEIGKNESDVDHSIDSPNDKEDSSNDKED